ncbi:MAG: AbrB/MazE/SpoVT family DNA-binding domain-containing protein [Candidatus Dormibacteria bacterium]
MTLRVGPKGQVVIPKAIRERIGLQPGAEVDVTARDGEVIVTAHRTAVGLGGRFKHSGMAERLLADRALERP